MSNSMELHGVLCRYLSDLQRRTFPDNDEGDHGIRWTNAEIKRVEQLVAAESSLATLNAELLDVLGKIKMRLEAYLDDDRDMAKSSMWLCLDYAEKALSKARSQS
ncbi:hypothetical protein ACNFCJ_21030 [Pseudomonas sp. NY15364]|uniref:hypothetical protein n=1 Tax=Pseudomonas sp. NY15364 TaxID=3400353 RepID=UPI003A846506